MGSRRFRLVVALFLCALAPFLAAGPAGADAVPLQAGVARTLVGSSAGAIDHYTFTVPGATTAPTVTVAFTPPAFADGHHAGFNVSVNGAQQGSGAPAGNAGTVQYTLPHSPSGVAVVQVFAFDAVTTVGYTITTSGVPAGSPSGAAGGSAEGTKRLNGKARGTMRPHPTGSLPHFTFPSPGSTPPTTVFLAYSPADARVEQAVGFNVLDSYGNTIASAVQPKGQNQPNASLSVDLSRPVGEALSIDVFNHAPGVTISYQLAVSGIPPPAPAAAPAGSGPPVAAPAAGTPGATPVAGFQPFWVENFRVTPLWSGPDGRAVSFGLEAQFSSFLVVRPQAGRRLYVFNPRTRNYAYLDAKDAGPSGPPAGG